MERKMIADMLRMEIPRSRIAQKMQVSRTTLYRKMHKYGLA